MRFTPLVQDFPTAIPSARTAGISASAFDFAVIDLVLGSAPVRVIHRKALTTELFTIQRPRRRAARCPGKYGESDFRSATTALLVAPKFFWSPHTFAAQVSIKARDKWLCSIGG